MKLVLYQCIFPLGRIIFCLLTICLFYKRINARDREIWLSQWQEIVSVKQFVPEDTAAIMATLKLGPKLRELSTDSALKLLYTTYHRSIIIGFNDGVAGSLIEIGRITNDSGDQHQALDIYNKALWYAKRSRIYPHFTAACYANIGSIYLFMTKYDLAATYFDSALAEGPRVGLSPERSQQVIIYNNLGVLYLNANRPELALGYLLKAEDIATRNHYNRELKQTYCNLGDAYAVLNNKPKAIAAFSKAIKMSDDTEDKEIAQAAHLGIGKFFLLQKQPAKAVKHLEKAKDIGIFSSIYYGKLGPSYELGKAYYELNQYDQAEKTLLQALSEAQKTGFENGILAVHQTLGSIYEDQGKYKKAIEQFRICEKLNANILNKEKLNQINELAIKYQTVEKDRQLAYKDRQLLLTSISARKKNIITIIAGTVILLLLTGIIVLRWFQKNKLKRVRLEQELERHRAMLIVEERERTRIGQELHDGIGGYFSTIKINLASLRMKIPFIIKEPLLEKTMDIADEANEELREIAHNLVPRFLNKNGLGKAIENFYRKQGLKDEGVITVQETGEPFRFDKTTELAIYRNIQEIVHNIIKHAEASLITICISWQFPLLMIAVEDNGNGLFNDQYNGDGIGINNILSRVKAFNGSMTVNNFKDQGTSVYLEFELSNPTNNKIDE